MSEVKRSFGSSISAQESDKSPSVNKYIIVSCQQVFKTTVFCSPVKTGLNLEHFIHEGFGVIALDNVTKYLGFTRDAIRQHVVPRNADASSIPHVCRITMRLL